MSAPPAKGDGDARLLNPAAFPLLERYGGRRGRQVLALVAAGQLFAPIARWAHEKARQRDDYTITVADDDDIYPDLHEWVLARMPESDRKALIASTDLSDHGKVSAEHPDGDPTPARVRLRYDGSRRQAITIEGHGVVVTVESKEYWGHREEKIVFTASSGDGRDVVVRMINGLLAEKYNGPQPPALYMPSRYGDGWTRRGDLPPRTLDSVVLKDGQREHLVDDLASFLASEETYNRLSQPWHRGYLFHGEPGTGKTSIARGLANHFGLPTYYLPLGDIEKDTNLMSFVSAIPPRSMLLLEDIDVFSAATEREEGEEKKASMAAVLNALDGVFTPHGLITVMTTNDRENLDPALVRAGRVDVDEEFSALDLDQAQRLAERFGSDLDAGAFDGRSPSELIEALRRSSPPERCAA